MQESNSENRFHLKEDIKGIYVDTFFARKGDEVTLMKTEGNISFVEDTNGSRFRVPVELLSAKIITKQEAAPAAAVADKPISNRAPAAQKKAAPINQQTLF